VTRAAAAARLVLGAAALFAVLVLAGLLIAKGLHRSAFERADGRVDRWLAHHRTGTLDGATHVFTYLAETGPVAAAAVALVVLLRVVSGGWRAPLLVALTVGGEVLVFLAVTATVHRHRPPVHRLDAAPPTSSFPSGHTAAAVALYGSVAAVAVRLGWRVWVRRALVVLAVAVPVLVAFARLYRGMHYPTDVLAGALLGLAWLAVVTSTVCAPPRRVAPVRGTAAARA
jgi:undecaprenyl-diphosphatase